MFDLSNYSIKQIPYDNSNRLVVVKMKDGTTVAATEEFLD